MQRRMPIMKSYCGCLTRRCWRNGRGFRAEAVAARSDPDLVIIGRTNAIRIADLDEALRRGEAYREAGADMIFVHTRNAEEMRVIGERLGPPLMIFAPEDGFAVSPLTPEDLAGLGFRLAASSGSSPPWG